MPRKSYIERQSVVQQGGFKPQKIDVSDACIEVLQERQRQLEKELPVLHVRYALPKYPLRPTQEHMRVFDSKVLRKETELGQVKAELQIIDLEKRARAEHADTIRRHEEYVAQGIC